MNHIKRKQNLIASTGKWIAALLLLTMVLTSCNRKFHGQQTGSMLVIEEYAVIEEVQLRSSGPGRDCMLNYSFSSGHINSRRIDDIYYSIFITFSFDSLVICPSSGQHEIRSMHFPEPLAPLAGAVRQLYYHNHDSVFLMFDRGTVLSIRPSMEDFSDIYLLNREGVIINQYNLDSVLWIYSREKRPYINLSHKRITDNLITNGELFLAFYIVYDPDHDTLIRNKQISTIAAIDLSTGGVRMLNIPPPLDLHERNLLGAGRGYYASHAVFNDSTLIYHFPPSPSLYLYDLSEDQSINAFTYSGNHFINDKNPVDLSQEIWFEIPQYIPALSLYFRKTHIMGYKNFEPFVVAQFFDRDFNHLGYFFEDNTPESIFFRNYKNQLCIRLQDQESMLSVKPGRARPQSKEYIEQNLLVRKPASPFDESLKEKSYEERVVLYLKNFDLPDDSRIVMYSMRGACSNILSFLMESYWANHGVFGERNVLYLFYDPNIESTIQMIENYNLDNTTYIAADTNRLFMRYFYPAEYGRNPLVLYHNEKEAEVMTYTPQTLYEKYGKLLEKSGDSP
jgi:hypothetical protein